MAFNRTNHYFSTAESAVDYKPHEKQDANAFLSIEPKMKQASAKATKLRTNKKALTC